MQILSTKLSIPPLRSRLVHRPRLIQKLNQGLECGLVLISAPAGYGKTTLLSAWLNRADFSATWFSLDDSDNDPTRFLSYLVAAFGVVDPSFEAIYNPSDSIDPQLEFGNLLTPLINRLTQRKEPLYLVLDDYHVIQNLVIHQAIEFILEHRPPTLHLVISTRADPPLPLARLRAQSTMQEIRMADLRFTLQEATDFLNHTMSLDVTPDDVSRVTNRTEGWIAGLQMAALSMQNADDIPGFINNLTGTHHYIFDYLIEEILQQQSTEIHRFLLYTSILDQLTAPLCDALLKVDQDNLPTQPASVILEELEHANLFIIPLDHEQRWYRYHPLFAELLRGYLQHNDPHQIPILHQRASAWFEDHGLITSAIHHLFAARDWEGVVRLVSAHIFALLEQNELSNVSRQLDKLIATKSSARPWLLMGRAWLAAYTGQLDSVEPILKNAEAEINNLNNELELQTLGGHIAVIRAYINWIGSKRDVAINAAMAALEWMPDSEHLLRCQAETLLGLTLDDFNACENALKRALAHARECNISHVPIFAQGCWAWMLSIQGRLRESAAACHETIQSVKSSSSHQPIPTLSHVYSTLSFVLCEWNDLEGAVYYAKEAVNLARQWGQADALHFALDNLAYALFASGDTGGAWTIHNEAWKVARNTSRWFEDITISQEVEWYLALDNLDAALECLRRAKVQLDVITIDNFNSQKGLLMPLSFIQIYNAQKQYSKALSLIDLLLDDLKKRNIGNFIIRLLTWQALAYNGSRQQDQALSALKRALALAAPEGYLRTFIKHGPRMISLLHQAKSAGIMPDYVDTILTAAENTTKTLPIGVVSTSGLVEPLSEREKEVLKQLAQGCTDKKIAENLVIARETVHKHLKNIYSKLDVHSRTEAIARARDLKLL